MTNATNDPTDKAGQLREFAALFRELAAEDQVTIATLVRALLDEQRAHRDTPNVPRHAH